MKKFITIILALFLGAQGAYADACGKALTGPFPDAQARKLCTYFINTASLSSSLTFTGTGPIIAPTSFGFAVASASTPNYTLNNVRFNMPSTGVLAASTAIALAPGSANTPVVTFNTSGMTFGATTHGIVYAPYVATPATNLTPVAGTNDFLPLTVVATAAPTNAAIALPASPTDGEVRRLIVTGANPVVVAALGTPSMNMAVTPGPRRYIAAGKSTSECIYSAAAASWMCNLVTLPTPAT